LRNVSKSAVAAYSPRTPRIASSLELLPVAVGPCAKKSTSSEVWPVRE
jgi:hypothetical protein